jgi:hypothetical protein
MLVLPLDLFLLEWAYTACIDLSLDALHWHYGHVCKCHLCIMMMLKAKGITPTTKLLSLCTVCIKNKTTHKPICKGPVVRSMTPME